MENAINFLPFALLGILLYTIMLAVPSVRENGFRSRWSPVIPIAAFTYFLLGFDGSTQASTIWEHQLLPIKASFQIDGLSRLFALLITGIGSLIFIYANGYMKGAKHVQRLQSFLMLFMLAMLGVVLSDDLIMLFVFWELTSISSFFLIGFKNEDEASRKSALQAITITGMGGLIMLGGFIILGEIAGTYAISEMHNPETITTITGHAWFAPMLILILAGAFTKSAQFPFHFWLPGAMKAPTPVSAYLHSATMVKAGVYLLARFSPILGDTPVWNIALMSFGGFTMVYAAFQALFRTDMKSILAYTTVSALGIMVFLLGLQSSDAIAAVSLFILVHALYKASFFMLAGTVDHETGTRDISQLGGLGKVMMPLFAIGILAAWSNGGVPPSVGFLGKDLIYESTLHHPVWAYVFTGLSVVTNIMLFAAGLLVGWLPFRGKSTHPNTHMPHWTLWVPAALLAVLGMLFGLFPALINDGLINPVANAIAGAEQDVHLKLWHGFNTVLYLSLLTMGAGLLLYTIIKPGATMLGFIETAERMGPRRLLHAIANGFVQISSWVTQTLQNGKLRIYLLVILGFLVFLLGYVVLSDTSFVIDKKQLSDITIYEGITVGILFTSVFLTLFSGSRLAAVAAMGVVGYTLCIIFVFYSAPDLAMTQFTIDTLTVILFVLVLYRLPRFIRLDLSVRHILDGLVAIAVGALMTVISLEVLQRTPEREISDFYALNAYVLAKGKNVVNVILVDFRGADTMIEIVVLSIAAIGVYSLLKLRLRKNEKME
jgi:multicomponent Na+:H+ antiporter subunit A